MISRLDATILITSILLALTGIVMIYSATYSTAGDGVSQPALQSIWFIIGITVMFSLTLTPARIIQGFTLPIFFLILVLLVVVLTTGSIKGSSRWLRFGPVGIQPSELAKVGVVLMMAHYLDGKAKIINHPKVLSVALLITGVPALMVLKQPDLGTSLVFGAILMGMLFWAGLSLRELGWLVSPAISLLVAVLSGFNWIVWSLFMAVLFGLLLWVRPAPRVFVGIMVLHIGIGVCAEPLWDSLHDYQRQRVVTFLDPQEDALGAGYQIIQSKIAIGSGGLTGRGYLQGTQTQLSFLPEQQTDFIFSVIGEELGFIGSTAVLLMLYILIYRGVKIAVQVRSRYHSLVAAGCVSVLAFHVIMNVGMTLGLLPVAGVPLPFLSYGGSFLLTCMTLCGLLMNVWKRRFEY